MYGNKSQACQAACPTPPQLCQSSRDTYALCITLITVSALVLLFPAVAWSSAMNLLRAAGRRSVLGRRGYNRCAATCCRIPERGGLHQAHEKHCTKAASKDSPVGSPAAPAQSYRRPGCSSCSPKPPAR
jgi:hypothetical protein